MIVIAEAHNGRQAVDLTRHYRPDVVLMDVVMPELDGIAATRRIVKENPDQVVVILTTADDDEIGLLGLRAGASGFLAKDVDIDVLPRTPPGRAQRRGRDLAPARHAAGRAAAPRARAAAAGCGRSSRR